MAYPLRENRLGGGGASARRQHPFSIPEALLRTELEGVISRPRDDDFRGQDTAFPWGVTRPEERCGRDWCERDWRSGEQES